MSSIPLLHQEKKIYYSNLDGIVAGQIFLLLPLVAEMFDLKIISIKGVRVGTTSEARALPLFKASTKFLIDVI